MLSIILDLEEVKNYCYLDSTITKDEGSTADMSNRINQ